MQACRSDRATRRRSNGRRRRLVALLLALSAGWLIGAGPVRAQPVPDPMARRIEALVRTGAPPCFRRTCSSALRGHLVAVYEPQGFTPLWLTGGRPTDAAVAAIRVLGAAGTHGLLPADYDAARLDAARRELAVGEVATAETLASFDIAITLGLMRHLLDLHAGRIDPKRLSFDYGIDPKPIDVVALVSEARLDRNLDEIVAEAEPKFAQYRRLIAQLARYRALARDLGVGPVVVPRTLRPGDPAPGAGGLARWLAALGDLPAASPPDDAVYGDTLVGAVRRFQERHGLSPDGVIGPRTTRALAVPAEQRVRQIELALERLRWLPTPIGRRTVFVNIPAFELAAVEAAGSEAEPVLQMRVVVGKAGAKTPAFAGVLETVVFSPYWNVPHSIVVHEELPKLRRNPGRLAARRFEIVSGAAVWPATAASIEALAEGRARLRQRPGPGNALGRVKFLFPNPHHVYLHDTPSRQLFAQSRRDFSHGCIRVEKPAELAKWVLRTREDWPPQRIDAAMAGTRETFVQVDPTVAVVIAYATAVARRDGTISFYEDVYGHDAALERALDTRVP
jgi:murein L,D-transpeptidase YcbB/YkuD